MTYTSVNAAVAIPSPDHLCGSEADCGAKIIAMCRLLYVHGPINKMEHLQTISEPHIIPVFIMTVVSPVVSLLASA